jgi:hypothetical protein
MTNDNYFQPPDKTTWIEGRVKRPVGRWKHPAKPHRSGGTTVTVPLDQSYSEAEKQDYERERSMRGVEFGECFCGCRGKTTIAESTDLSNHKLKGFPRRYIWHHGHRMGGPEYEIKDCGYRTPCWVWMRGSHTDRYGGHYGISRRRPGDKPDHAYVIIWERHRGSVPEGMDLARPSLPEYYLC